MNTQATAERGESEDGRPWIMLHKQKVHLYEFKEDGNGMKFKIANPMHPDNCPMTGVKEVEIIERKKRHDPDINFSRVDDPITGIIYGTVLNIDRVTKQLVFKNINLKARQEYDMARESDRQIWMVASRHSSMLGNPYASSHKPYFKVVDREYEAEQKIIKINMRTRALALIKDMRDGELVDMATNLGIVSPYSSQATLQAELMTSAEKDPKEFCNIYDASNRVVVTILNRCKAVGLVTTDPNQGILWKLTTPMGLTEAAAVRYITDHAALLQNMDFESKQKSENFRKFATKAEKDSTIAMSERGEGTVSKEDKFLTNQDLKNQAEKADAILERLLAKEKQLDEALAKVNPKAETAPERTIEDYRKKATELGYADADAISDKKVLATWISNKLKEKKTKE